METYQVGSNIDSWCTRCKLVLAHTIEAIANGVIKRVVCNTCKGKHQYKGEEPGKKIASRPAASKARSRVSDFTKLMAEKDENESMPYNMRTQFVKGDVISHATFGRGVVVEDKDQQKIEVLFECGPKILVHARA